MLLPSQIVEFDTEATDTVGVGFTLILVVTVFALTQLEELVPTIE